jgi:hypothetical protein
LIEHIIRKAWTFPSQSAGAPNIPSGYGGGKNGNHQSDGDSTYLRERRDENLEREGLKPAAEAHATLVWSE